VEVKGIIGDLKDFTTRRVRDPEARGQGQDRHRVPDHPADRQGGPGLEDPLHVPEADVQFKDTVCKPTKDRQVAVRELAAQVDVMIVVGGFNSANTKKLKLVCDEMGVEAYQIERAQEIRSEMFDGKEHVGITAGTSTPHVIEEAHNAINRAAWTSRRARPPDLRMKVIERVKGLNPAGIWLRLRLSACVRPWEAVPRAIMACHCQMAIWKASGVIHSVIPSFESRKPKVESRARVSADLPTSSRERWARPRSRSAAAHRDRGRELESLIQPPS
jgi:hypothetical protein